MKCRIVLLERLYAALLVKKCIQNNEEEMEMKEMFKIDTAGDRLILTFETEQSVLNPKIIENLVNRYLL